jgi:prepilin-type N-terminal cleavage/methylation domain-containing protein/prepilin-type processing-associated H-X9-DG protein
MPRVHRPEGGFTLVELLTVVAIIAVLAAILFPVVARARESARRATCLSNLKLAGYACLAYVQDNDETFPMSVYPLDGTDENGHLSLPSPGAHVAIVYDALLPYLKTPELLRCPSDPGGDGAGMDLDAALKEAGLVGTGAVPTAAYGWNFAVFQDPSVGPTYDDADPVHTLADLTEAAATTLFYDAQRYAKPAFKGFGGEDDGGGIVKGKFDGSDGETPDGGGEDDCNTEMAGNPLEWNTMPGAPRHHGGLNVGFADGHVRWVPENGTLPGESPGSVEYPEPVPTYHVPWDLSGIPGGAPDT